MGHFDLMGWNFWKAGKKEKLLMQLRHLTPDTPRTPHHLSAGGQATLRIGTHPVEPGQTVWVEVRVVAPTGQERYDRVEADWHGNEENDSYWQAVIGPFADAEHVTYTVYGRSPSGEISTPPADFSVGPTLHLALLWHMHQPFYRDLSCPNPQGAYPVPWVRLHALRDYYSMAALVSEFPDIHLTINLVPALLWQIEDYTERAATDVALELTRKPAETLSAEEQEAVLATFFAADWHHQIYPHPRYHALFEQRARGEESIQMTNKALGIKRDFIDQKGISSSAQ